MNIGVRLTNIKTQGGDVIIPPPKIHHFKGFCKFCFYKDLDMYIKGKNPTYEAQTWKKLQACKQCLKTIFEKIVDFLDKQQFSCRFYL